MVFFPPSVVPPSEEAESLRNSFQFMNELGRMAVEEYGVRMGLHNHTDSGIENQQQVDRFLEGTDPRHVFCGGIRPICCWAAATCWRRFKKSADRIVYTDFKDATLKPSSDDYLSPNGQRFAGDSHQGRFFNSIFELGRGQIDFAALLRLLAAQKVSRLDQPRPGYDSRIDRRELPGFDGLYRDDARPGLSVSRLALRQSVCGYCELWPGDLAFSTSADMRPMSIKAHIFQSAMNDQSGYLKVAGRFFSIAK